MTELFRKVRFTSGGRTAQLPDSDRMSLLVQKASQIDEAFLRTTWMELSDD